MDAITSATWLQGFVGIVGVVFTIFNVLIWQELRGMRRDVRALFTGKADHAARLRTLEAGHTECRRERLDTEQRIFERLDELNRGNRGEE